MEKLERAISVVGVVIGVWMVGIGTYFILAGLMGLASLRDSSLLGASTLIGVAIMLFILILGTRLIGMMARKLHAG